MNIPSSSNWEKILQLLVPFCIFTYAYFTIRTKIPLVPTQKAARKIILDLIRDDIQKRQNKKIKIYDLGAGLGGLALAIAKEFPDAEVIGLEMGFPIWLAAYLRQKLSFRKNLRFELKDFWKRDISDGDIVVCYLGTVVMAPLAEKLRKEPKENRLFISNTFPLPKDWPPTETITVPAKLSKTIYVYR